MSNDDVTLEVHGLDQILKALKGQKPTCRIGVLGGKSSREGGGPTNAEIGAAHEYGAPSRGLPVRSFLRVPISDRLQKDLEKSGALTEAEFKEVVRTGSVLPWLKKVAVLAEGIVRGAFDTGGYGAWKAWKDPNYTNNAGQILVDTTQLRDSITSEVRA